MNISTLNVVSGATGFLGAYMVCYLLNQGEEVRAIRRNGSSMSEFDTIFDNKFKGYTPAEIQNIRQKLHWVEGDVLDVVSLENALQGATAVYHCAAVVSFLQKDRNRMMQVNAYGTANMVNTAINAGIQKFCHVSSIAALGREHSGDHMDENSKWVRSDLNSNYAISKHKAEMEVWRAMEEGLHAVIVNPGVILGAGNWEKGSCRLFGLPWKNFPFYTEGINGYVDVNDTVAAMYRLMQEPRSFGERWVLVGENLNMRDFMHLTADYLGRTRARIRVRPWMAGLAWMFFAIKHLFGGKEPSVTRETSRASLHQYFYSSEKIIRQLPFTFTPIKETLHQICQQYLTDHNP